MRVLTGDKIAANLPLSRANLITNATFAAEVLAEYENNATDGFPAYFTSPLFHIHIHTALTKSRAH